MDTSIPLFPSAVDAACIASGPESVACYHCGETVVQPGRWRAPLAGAARDFCCAGCEAVAHAIHGAGLQSFYQRCQAVGQPLESSPDEHAVYDHPALQQGLVTVGADGSCEAALLLEGVRCAACVWLNEAHLKQLPGVLEVAINYTTRRARVRWQPDRIRLSAILRAVADIGYRAHPYDPALQEAVAQREARWLLLRAGVAALAMMQVMMFAVPAYVSADGVDPAYERLFRWASLLLTLPAVAFSGWPFLAGAVRSLRQRTLGMDVPIALGLVVAFAASAWATWTGRGEVYYDSVTMFVALLLTARYFELRARQRAAAVVESLARSVPPVAERLIDYPRSLVTETVAASALVPGGLTLIRPGATIPADGVVVDGVSHADEALVTGESRPVPKQAGAEVMAGSVNRESQLVVRVTRIAAESRVSQILRLVERALHERPSIGRAADRVAAWSVAGILVAAALAGAYWWLTEPGRALPVVVAVLVVSCPCALSLAVPTALASATASLARRGILVTRGDAIEAMARATDVAFDKTGTLTDGHFALVGVFPHRALDREACLARAAALEGGSEHPIAAALRGASRAAAPAVGDLRSVGGCGVEGVIDGRRYRLGSPTWVARLHSEPLPIESRLLAAHVSPIALADEQGWIAWFTFADRLRPAAASTVGALHDAGMRVHLLSGDRPATVAHCGELLKVDSAAGGLEPEGKLAWLREKQQQGARVMMVGDGVNDAPVLAGAQVSAAMASATPLAMVSADVVLLRDDVAAVGVAIRESRRALRVMWQNFGWAILYNAIAIPAAAAGAITPLAAGIGMSLSSLLVVANSLRLAARRDSRALRTDPSAVPAPAATAA